MQRSRSRRSRTKLPVDPERLRRMPPQFAPIDRRLVYDKHVCHMSHTQIVLYLFLQCVSDVQGLSYYSDERICEYLHLDPEELQEARRGLVRGQHVLYRRPMYQLLDLPSAKHYLTLRDAHFERAVGSEGRVSGTDMGHTTAAKGCQELTPKNIDTSEAVQEEWVGNKSQEEAIPGKTPMAPQLYDGSNTLILWVRDLQAFELGLRAA